MKKILEFFRRDNGQEKRNFALGIVIGLVAALVIMAIVYLSVVGGWTKLKFWEKRGGTETGGTAKLRITIITKKDCTDCFDINLLLDAIKQQPVKELGRETVYLGTAKADQLIQKYKITKVPTVIIGGDLEKNSELKQMFTALGEIVDGAFVFRQVIPPYIDVATGELKGKLSITYLSDSSCKECYDVNLHQNALESLGIFIKDRKNIDASSDEGKALIKQYSIALIPTIIIKGETDAYPSLGQIWDTYGKVTKDGTYIFTKLEEMGTYKDLSKNKVITIKPATTTQ